MLPYRFKAGGPVVKDTMSISAQTSHHHRSTTKQDHKPFKSRHATKSALKDAAKGKVENEDRGKRRTPHQQVMSKLVRKNQAKQARLTQKAKKEQDLDIYKGLDGAPKHVAVVPLSADVDVNKAIQQINASVDIDSTFDDRGNVRVRVERYGRNVLFMPSTTESLQAMDVCRLADLVVFVMAADKDIDEDAHNLLKVIEGQGVTTVHFAVQCAQGSIPDNKLHKRLAELKSAAEYYFPILDKMSVMENKNDCSLLMRKICTSTTKGIVWRDSRSWMHIDAVQWRVATDGTETSNVVLSGIVRGKNLNPDRLVYVNGWGEYQVERITQSPKKAHKRKADEMTMDEDRTETRPSPDQDDLAELAPEPVDMDDTMTTTTQGGQKGVLLDDHHYFSDDNSHIPNRPAKLPTGTSDYQSAWYLEDISDSEDEIMEDDVPTTEANGETNMLNPEDGDFIAKEDAMTDAPGTEYPESEMHIDQDEEEEAKQLAEYRQSRKTEAEEDLEFPDEIELPPNVLARERLAKYRGLKSLRTSEWNTVEDAIHEPSEFKRLLQVPDYKKSYNTAMKETLTGGIPAGTHVEIELRNVPARFQPLQPPTAMYSLLRHEHKKSIINLTITLDSTYEHPLRSKDELIIQIGFRRLAINPIYSASGNTPNNVHKFSRYLHPGQTATATFIGPLTWGSIPVLVFKPQSNTNSSPSTDLGPLIAHATLTPPSTPTNRIIAKRIVLTGHPYKIHKKLVTIRYMFFNREDVEWFKALPLWTKRGRQGFIKEALGTHGYFKATFDGNGRVNGMDAVGVSLYKRVWPREGRRVEMV